VPEVLSARRLGRGVGGEFRPNYACLLLFANDPIRSIPGCKIHFQRFEGEHEGTGEKYNAVKDVILEGCVPKLIRQAEEVLDSQLRTFSPLDAKGKFYPVPEYPKAAWYEAVVNACVHRSYGNGMKNMPIFVKMFDDRLVVESPGPFPPFVTPENIYDEFIQHPRNPQLMDAMFYLEYVKAAHEGVRRMRDTMVAMKLPIPEFSAKPSVVGNALVRVILRNNIKQRRTWIDRDVSKIVSEAIASDFDEHERRAINWVAEHGRITISDANRLLGLTWARAKKLLLGLAEKKVFQYVRFVPYKKDVRDSRAFFRLRSNSALPEGAFEQTTFESTSNPKRKHHSK
jgi:ATP-dependent DNA helicase RecG